MGGWLGVGGGWGIGDTPVAKYACICFCTILFAASTAAADPETSTQLLLVLTVKRAPDRDCSILMLLPPLPMIAPGQQPTQESTQQEG